MISSRVGGSLSGCDSHGSAGDEQLHFAVELRGDDGSFAGDYFEHEPAEDVLQGVVHARDGVRSLQPPLHRRLKLVVEVEHYVGGCLVRVFAERPLCGLETTSPTYPFFWALAADAERRLWASESVVATEPRAISRSQACSCSSQLAWAVDQFSLKPLTFGRVAAGQLVTPGLEVAEVSLQLVDDMAVD